MPRNVDFNLQDYRDAISRQRRFLFVVLLSSPLVAAGVVVLYLSPPPNIFPPEEYLRRWQDSSQLRHVIRGSLLPFGGAVIGLAALIGITKIPSTKDGVERNAQFSLGYKVVIVSTLILLFVSWLSLPFGGEGEGLTDAWLPVATILLVAGVLSQLFISDAMRYVSRKDVEDLQKKSQEVMHQFGEERAQSVRGKSTVEEAGQEVPGEWERGMAWIKKHALPMLIAAFPFILLVILAAIRFSWQGWSALFASVAFIMIYAFVLSVSTYAVIHWQWKIKVARGEQARHWPQWLAAWAYPVVGNVLLLTMLILLLTTLSAGGPWWIWVLALLCAVVTFSYPWLYRRFLREAYDALVRQSMMAYRRSLERSHDEFRGGDADGKSTDTDTETF